MSTGSAFKKIVSARMEVTGEAWAVASRAVLAAARTAIPWPAEPCAHPGSWVPEAFILADGGRSVEGLKVRCDECGWSGRVTQEAMMTGQGYDVAPGQLADDPEGGR